MASYFQDMRSGVVLKFDMEWDRQEMKKNPEYKEVDEEAHKAYVKEREKLTRKTVTAE